MPGPVSNGTATASGTESNPSSEDAFDIGYKLRQRLKDAQTQKERTQATINALSEQLQRMFARAPKKPKDTVGQMDDKISKLEYTRTSKSLNLSDEKVLLRQIDVIKRAKKSLVESRQHEVAIQEKKSEISSRRDYLRTVMASIAELESALAKVDLAKRLGCETSELQTTIVDCPSDKIGHIIGKNGSSLKQLEKRTGVRIDVDKVGSKIHLEGSVSALNAAVREVENITLAIEEEVKLTLGITGYLTAKKSAVLSRLQQSHPLVHFDVSRNSPLLRLRGKPDNVSVAKLDINTLDVITVSRNLLSKETGLIVGKGGVTITKLVEEHDVYINVEDNNDEENGALLEITGPHDKVENATVAIERLLHENEEMEDFIVVEPMQRNMFLSNGGAALKATQKEITKRISKNGMGGGVLLVFERKDEDEKFSKSESSTLIIKCSRANMDVVKAMIEKQINDHEATVSSITVDPSMISAIIGKGGSNIKNLRKDGVEIEVSKESGVIKIQSEDENAKDDVIAAIKKIVSENQVETVKVEKSMIGIMLGEIGKGMKKKVTEDLGVWLGVDSSDEHIILRGTQEKIDEAAIIVKEFITQNYTEEIEIPPEDVLVLLGGSQSYLSKLGSEHNIKANLRRGRQSVSLRGEKENVTNAAAELHNFVFGGNGTIVTKLRVQESSLGFIIGKGGAHIAKLEKEYEGVSLDIQRSSNQLSMRGPELKVKECRAHIISVLATSKFTETLKINSKDYDTLTSKSNVMKRITNDINVQVTMSERAIKLRGIASDINDVKARINEQLTGRFDSAIELETQHFMTISKASEDSTQLDRIRENNKVDITFDAKCSTIFVSGKRVNVKKAKNQLTAFMESLLPSQFIRIKMSKPVLKAVSKPVILAGIASQTGAQLILDRELNGIQIRCLDPKDALEAKSIIETKILECEKLNIVVRLDPADAWLFPKIIGKDGSCIQDMEAKSGCKIEVSKAENTIIIYGETSDIASNGKKALDNVISKARKENVFISLPESAMPSFIGKGKENIKKISQNFNVVIDRLSKDPSTILIKGNEVSVESAATAVSKWLLNWEASNKGITMTLNDATFLYFTKKGSTIITSIQNDTRTNIDLKRSDGSLTIRGNDVKLRNLAVQKINDVIKREQSKKVLSQKKSNAIVDNLEEKEAILNKRREVNGMNGHNTNEILSNGSSNEKSKINVTSKIIKPKSNPEDIKGESDKLKKNGNSAKVNQRASVASQGLFNMLISENDGDSSTISSAAASYGDFGPDDDNTGERTLSVKKSKVYRSTSGFSVRV